MKKPQEFYVTLRVFIDPNSRKLTENGMKKILQKALDPDKMDDSVETIRFGDVIDVTK